jgi:preprotein translocase subunit SecF
MKKTIAIVLSVIFVLAVASLAFAGTKQVTGDITAVDAKASTVTVKGRSGEVTVDVVDSTKIKAGAKSMTLQDLKAGEKVKVVYTEADGKNTAKTIEMKAKAGGY